jgi:predicted class III extradiol MEMO1 family dioxygenase
MQYREPSVADLFAAADTRTLAEWERVLPDIPRDLASTLELIARLHLAPPAAEMPTGKFYAELLRRLPPQTTIAVLRRIDTIAAAFGLDNIEALAEAKKKPSKRAVKR